MTGPGGDDRPGVAREGERGDRTAELTAMLDEEAVDAAVRARRAAREGRDRARELATWVGTLRDLAERTAPVQVRTEVDTAPSGRLVGVADDHLVLRRADGGLTVVAREATTGIRETAEHTVAVPAGGGRSAPTDQTLLEVVDRWREDGATVHLVTRGGDSERGRLATVGEDVLSLVTAAGVLHVPADAVVSVTVR